ncbi:MAG: DUF4421 domain-containing protein [Bacteroidetes bacterium]|jgi:hypothetical protein|nr:DUF4421 domain-containing protein [Bacteroidota bacterium]
MHWLFTTLTCLLCLPVLAQTRVELSAEDRLAKRNAFDSTYIQPYYRGLTLRPRTQGYGHAINIASRRAGTSSFLYEPNLLATIGLHGSYNGLGFGISYKLPNSAYEPAKYGRTRKLDLSLDFTSRRWLGELTFTGIQGFYLPDPGRFYQPERALPPLVRPDMFTAQIGFGYTRIFNPKRFTIRALFGQTEVQTRSAGSFLLQGQANVFGITSDSSLVPGPLRPSYPELDSATNINLSSLGVSPGYAHTFVLHRFSLGVMALLGPGLQRSVVKDGEDVHIYGRLYYNLEWRTVLNYARPRWFAGFSISGRSSTFRLHGANLTHGRVQTELYFGYRFPQVRLLKNWRWLDS